MYTNMERCRGKYTCLEKGLQNCEKNMCFCDRIRCFVVCLWKAAADVDVGCLAATNECIQMARRVVQMAHSSSKMHHLFCHFVYFAVPPVRNE